MYTAELDTSYIETAVSTRPAITTEAVDGVTIGRVIVRLRPFGGETFRPAFDGLTRKINTEFTREQRGSLVHRLNHNNVEGGPIQMERPVSAYFTLDSNNRKLIIEWGKINPDDQLAKLHTYLNSMINYHDRTRQGMKLSSGHIGRLPEAGYLALLDNLSTDGRDIDPASDMGRLINTLHATGFLPIRPDGYAQPRVVRQPLSEGVLTPV